MPNQAENKKKDGDFVNFRKLLITRCQLEFERNSVDESKRNQMVKEIDECTDVVSFSNIFIHLLQLKQKKMSIKTV